MTRNEAIDRVFRATQDARNVNIGWLIDALVALDLLRFDEERLRGDHCSACQRNDPWRFSNCHSAGCPCRPLAADLR